MIPNNPDTASVCQSDYPVFGSRGSASTPVKNIAIIGYFEKRCGLIGFLTLQFSVPAMPPFPGGGCTWVGAIGHKEKSTFR